MLLLLVVKLEEVMNLELPLEIYLELFHILHLVVLIEKLF